MEPLAFILCQHLVRIRLDQVRHVLQLYIIAMQHHYFLAELQDCCVKILRHTIQQQRLNLRQLLLILLKKN